MRQPDARMLGLLAAAIAVAATSLAATAAAQERYPARPIRLVIPSVPAGVHDVIGRVWAEKVKPQLGTIVIDNRGGGGGLIGANDVAHAQPDGYSILLGSTTTHVLLTPAMASPPYDPVKDFSAVAVFAASSTSVVINASVPARTLAELIAYAKANPGKLSYGSAGNGSITNLAGELFKLRAGGLDIVHVPYKGIGQGVSDLIGGQIPMLSANATAQILDLHRAGKVRILAVNAHTRVKSAPDIPTATEAGLPDMVAQTTFGVFAPAGTPRPILERINAVTQEAMAEPQFQNELFRLGFEPVLDVGPDKAAGVFQEELARWTPILKATSTRAE
jgi:tripartite-type tricarboxylate transporter receptor subunit TctC